MTESTRRAAWRRFRFAASDSECRILDSGGLQSSPAGIRRLPHRQLLKALVLHAVLLLGIRSLSSAIGNTRSEFGIQNPEFTYSSPPPLARSSIRFVKGLRASSPIPLRNPESSYPPRKVISYRTR